MGLRQVSFQVNYIKINKTPKIWFKILIDKYKKKIEMVDIIMQKKMPELPRGLRV